MERHFPPMPNGWFVVYFSQDLAAGQVVPLHYFGRELVLFRTESGQAHVFDAYCPHLGAHIGHGGKVVGETVMCPFHNWRFEGSGQCVEVPSCPKIPPKAKARSWPVCEQDGAIHVWYHAADEPPSFTLPPLAREGWTEFQTIRWTVASHPQEITENTVDIAHMKPIHHTGNSRVSKGPTAEGPIMKLAVRFIASAEIIGMEGDNDVELDLVVYGVGEIVADAYIHNVGLHARYRVCSTAIDENETAIFGLVDFEGTGDPEFTRDAANLFFQAYTKDFVRDFPLWGNKIYRDRPLLSAADGPIGFYRKWARQFYTKVGAQPSTEIQHSGPTPGERAREVLREATVSASRLLSRVSGALRLPAALARVSRGDTPTPVAATAETAFERASNDAGPPPVCNVGKVGSVEQYFATLHERFVPAATQGIDAVFQWEIRGEGGGTYHAIVQDGNMRLVDGRHPSPTVTISMDASEYVRVVNGELNGPRAFTLGSGKISGKLQLAMKMRHIFPIAS